MKTRARRSATIAGAIHHAQACQKPLLPELSWLALVHSLLLKQVYLHARHIYMRRKRVPLAEFPDDERSQLARMRDDEPDSVVVFDGWPFTVANVRVEVAWAERVLDAYMEATAAGKGAISVDGKMIDAASLRVARAIVTKAHLAAARGGSDR